MTLYPGISPCFLHTAGEGPASKAQGSHVDALADLLGGLRHLEFLLGRLEAGDGLLMGQLHRKQLVHIDIYFGRALHEDTIPLQCIGRAISHSQLSTVAVVAFVAHQHDWVLMQVVAPDLAYQLIICCLNPLMTFHGTYNKFQTPEHGLQVLV